MRRLCLREWNWQWNWCVNQHSWDPWQRTRDHALWCLTITAYWKGLGNKIKVQQLELTTQNLNILLRAWHSLNILVVTCKFHLLISHSLCSQVLKREGWGKTITITSLKLWNNPWKILKWEVFPPVQILGTWYWSWLMFWYFSCSFTRRILFYKLNLKEKEKWTSVNHTHVYNFVYFLNY